MLRRHLERIKVSGTSNSRRFLRGAVEQTASQCALLCIFLATPEVCEGFSRTKVKSVGVVITAMADLLTGISVIVHGESIR